eukprot:TRINITY_DN50412_c0_g1_i1.p1 TRINITY_DN50412_c0_g1~~TRINITY_DN50412_c0_g1_i1.p1  ORF type:complete len:631 (-),score=83.57 TRINITY_DN50412_c0_g1_i1:485-2377(-)
MTAAHTLLLPALAAVRLCTASPGAAECPCLNFSSPLAQEALPLVMGMDKALHPQYGLDGCQAYDEGRSTKAGDCVAMPVPQWCAAKWCYVDKSVCPADEAACEASLCGAQACMLGDVRNPHCRSRENVRTGFKHAALLALDLSYSYATCGSADLYSFGHVHNYKYLATPLTSPPWSMQMDGEWVGVLPEFMNTVVKQLGQSSILLAEPGISAESMAAHNRSSFDACIHDIAIGRLDLCLADYWITESRMRLVNFLPALDIDNFYLVVPRVQESLWQLLSKPFRPFQWDAWLFIIALIILMGMLVGFVERGHNEDDFPGTRPMMLTIAKGGYMGLLSLVGAAPAYTTVTLPGRLITMGLGIFVLLAVGAYTANLATFLLTSRLEVGITSVAQAVDNQISICIASTVKDEAVSKFPPLSPLLVEVNFYKCAQEIHAGRASAAIMSQTELDKMYAGEFVRSDCKGIELGSSAVCPLKDGHLDYKRDCNLQKVGDVFMSNLLAIPANSKIVHALGWAQVLNSKKANFDKVKSAYRDQFPQQMLGCPWAGLSAFDPMPMSSFFGMSLVSGLCILISLPTMLINRFILNKDDHKSDRTQHIQEKLDILVGQVTRMERSIRTSECEEVDSGASTVRI